MSKARDLFKVQVVGIRRRLARQHDSLLLQEINLSLDQRLVSGYPQMIVVFISSLCILKLMLLLSHSLLVGVLSPIVVGCLGKYLGDITLLNDGGNGITQLSGLSLRGYGVEEMVLITSTLALLSLVESTALRR